jgi:hypothetical protein
VSLSKRVKNLEAQHRPPEDTRFEPWGSDEARAAWREVSAAEKDYWWGVYGRCGPYQGPALVRCGPDGTWQLTAFNTKFGAIAYCVQSALRALGVEAFLGWAEAECTPLELETLGRAFAGNWNPEYLHDGDVNVLSGVTPRLPRGHR